MLVPERTRRGSNGDQPPLPPGTFPSLRAVPFNETGPPGAAVRLLSHRQQHQLAALSTRIRLPPRAIVYAEEANAESAFIVAEGVVKAFRHLPNGRRRVVAFLFPEDIFGLAESGFYVNTAQAVTPVLLYRIRLDVLMTTLKHDPELHLQILCKIAHELRESQRQTIIVSRRDATGRVAMLLRLLERQTMGLDGPHEIQIPMTRSDAANYLGLSLEAVSRACRRLERSGIVSFPNLRAANVVDRPRFDKLAAMR
jgi:CRP-like cAMP-binding protein